MKLSSFKESEREGPAVKDEEALAAATHLRYAVTHLSRRMREESGPDTPLTPSRFNALSSVGAKGPMRLTELARSEKVSKSSITRVVTALNDVGLIELLPDPTDGRSTLVGITPAGKQVLLDSSEMTDEFLAAQLAALSEAERLVMQAAVLLFERVASSRSKQRRTKSRDPQE
jgi:DNA-binding MarR family transcriptional regulator